MIRGAAFCRVTKVLKGKEETMSNSEYLTKEVK